ncbi:hypothetical protein GCM10008090_34030 [Arenicella chitinivorans]|uniref:Uncharacterized protein n=1 Tax=Arenicella chitinivorans TaxID=1329800 RepID=A0A918VTF0_9GAMM|nr:hypothetical protein [Arenicella chitinivorans]GHA21237.1 hypothetical protein GCM10008090_34030 [Arenicella chitinivorans]
MDIIGHLKRGCITLAHIKIWILSFFISMNAFAYEIGPEIAGFAAVHQALTSNALVCLENNIDTKKPIKCADKVKSCIDRLAVKSSENLKNCFQTRKPSGLYLDKFSIDDLEKAVKWPDDPTYEAFGSGVAKFGAKMLQGCEGFLVKQKGLDNSIGLLCNTHFGNYQFWHAQSSTANESSKETRQKILDWAKFNYEVAVGKIEPQDDYCKYFRENESSISAIMKPENYPFCDERLIWGWVPKLIAKPYPAWDIATLYGVSCDNPFTSILGCKEELINNGSKRADNTVVSAIGALLHLIQDSFSQSHNVRGNCFDSNPESVDNPIPVSKIVCKPITRFTNYAEFDLNTQELEAQFNHDLSDDWPYIDDGCFSSSHSPIVDDPITASAKILWHIDKKSDWANDVLPDLESVFNIVEPSTTSGQGVCYAMPLD